MLLLALGLTLLPGGDWPQFRGPRGNGVVPAAPLPRSWSETESVAWKIAIPGHGWSQPIVVGDTLYVTTAVGPGSPRPLTYQAGVDAPDTSKDPVPASEIDWRVIAYDLASGKERWQASAAHGAAKFQIHPSNTHAPETPAADASGVYAYFGSTGTVAAFDTAGKARWKVELGAYPTQDAFGTGSSPVLHGGKLFVQVFSEERSFLVALDTQDGQEAWRVERGVGTAWNTPVLWDTGARIELVASGKKHIAGYDPASGKVLWALAGIDTPDSSSPGWDAERLYFGFRGVGVNGPLYALKAGASGVITPPEGKRALVGEAWQTALSAPGMPSPVSVNGQVFVLAGGFLSCFDAKTGIPRYKERLDGSGVVVASPIAVGDELVIVGESGKGFLVSTGPQFEVKGGGQLDDVLWATPTVAGDALLLRGIEHLYCLRAKGGG
ncbi:MAG: PQQ-binding-like beta-propeller repeat protein [Planctomycetota bacterium]